MFLRLINHQVTQRYEVNDLNNYVFLTLKIHAGEWPTSRPGCFIREERNPMSIQ